MLKSVGRFVIDKIGMRQSAGYNSSGAFFGTGETVSEVIAHCADAGIKQAVASGDVSARVGAGFESASAKLL